LGLLGVESQVVIGTPLCQVLNLLPVRRLIVVADEANHRCVVCKLYNGIRTMYSCAVVGEEGGGEGDREGEVTAACCTGNQDEGLTAPAAAALSGAAPSGADCGSG